MDFFAVTAQVRLWQMLLKKGSAVCSVSFSPKKRCWKTSVRIGRPGADSALALGGRAEHWPHNSHTWNKQLPDLLIILYTLRNEFWPFGDTDHTAHEFFPGDQ